MPTSLSERSRHRCFKLGLLRGLAGNHTLNEHRQGYRRYEGDRHMPHTDNRSEFLTRTHHPHVVSNISTTEVRKFFNRPTPVAIFDTQRLGQASRERGLSRIKNGEHTGSRAGPQAVGRGISYLCGTKSHHPKNTSQKPKAQSTRPPRAGESSVKIERPVRGTDTLVVC